MQEALWAWLLVDTQTELAGGDPRYLTSLVVKFKD